MQACGVGSLREGVLHRSCLVCRTPILSNCRVRGKGRVDSPPQFLLRYHCTKSLSIPLRSARSSIFPRMHPTVPSIDFKPFLRGSVGGRQRIAYEIDEALSSVGFVKLHNHGIEQYKVAWEDYPRTEGRVARTSLFRCGTKFAWALLEEVLQRHQKHCLLNPSHLYVIPAKRDIPT